VQAPVAQPQKTDFDLATTAQVGVVVATEELNPADEFVAAPSADSDASADAPAEAPLAPDGAEDDRGRDPF